MFVVTVSDSRTEETDTGGREARDACARAGFTVVGSRIVKDEPDAIRTLIRDLAAGGQIECAVLTGGTGISRRDRTPEALGTLLDRLFDGFGELFRALSYQEIGSAAFLSRAVGGLVESKDGAMAVFALPGSPAAVRLGLEKLILPEICHIVEEARR